MVSPESPRDAPAVDSAAAILLVDDNPTKRISITAVLEPLGITTIEAESGVAALHEVMERQFAVILMDVQMPVMDGYETAKLIRMRSESELTPIIFITGHEIDEAQVPLAYASGAVDFIFGTIVPDVLRAKVSIFTELFLKSRELEASLREVTMLSDQSRDREAHTAAVLDNVADGIITVSGEGVIESFNRAASVLFGYSEPEAVGKLLWDMMDSKPSGDAPAKEAFLQILAEHRSGDRSTESVGSRKDGTTFSMELDLSDVRLGTRRVHIVCLRDISERQAYTDALRHQTLYDALTDLPNRALFGDRVDDAIRVAQRSDEPRAILLLGLDEFKQVNDSLGHEQGDLLLKLVAERLVDCLGDADTVARLGGVEFAVLPDGATDDAGAAAVARKIQRALEPAFLVNDRTIALKASVGIARSPDHGANIDDLLRRADLAKNEAKVSGSSFALFGAGRPPHAVSSRS